VSQLVTLTYLAACKFNAGCSSIVALYFFKHVRIHIVLCELDRVSGGDWKDEKYVLVR